MTTLKRKTASTAIVECLRAEGIRRVFGLPGSQILPLIDDIYQADGIEFITTRHEHGASYAAYGYAAATGGPGACISTLGPGATNLLSGIAAAYKAALPVIAFTGKGGFKVLQKDGFQEIDEVSLYRPITKWSYMITNAEEVPSIIQKAFRIALSGRPGPVHLSVPSGTILPVEIQCEPFSPVQYRGIYDQPFQGFDQAFGEKITKAVFEAKNPVIMAGDEIRWEGVEDSLCQLAEMANIPVITALHFPDVFPSNHPLYMGNAGKDGWSCANEILKTADTVLALGVHLDFLTTKFKPDFFSPDTRIVHVSNYPERLGAVYGLDMGVICNVRAFLEGLKGIWLKKGIKRDFPPGLEDLRAGWLSERRGWGDLTSVPINPRFLAYRIHKALPDEAAWVSEGGNFVKFVRACTESKTRKGFFIAENYGAVGSGFPIAMGVKSADPSRPVVATLGDGGMMLGGAPDFETAVRAKLPFVSVIFNDGGFGNIRAYQKHSYGERYTSDFGNPNFGDLAKLYGGWGVQITQPEDFDPAFREAMTKDVPCILDVKIDPWELGTPLFTGIKVNNPRAGKNQ